MSLVKSVFIGVYPMIVMGVIGYAGWRLYLSLDVLLWAGPLLASVPFMMFLARIMMFQNVARTRANFPGMNALALGGAGLAGFAAFGRQGGGDPLALGLAILAALAFIMYSLWYSRLSRPPAPMLTIGKALPELGLKQVDGSAFSTRDLYGRTALIFFYRGNWCPLCMAQVKEVAARYREIAATGARVLLVSPQPHENTAALARRFDLRFDFLTDEGNRAARMLGIEAKNGLPMGMGVLGYSADTVLPTVIVLDAAGVIRWVDQTDNYRVRPEPDTFLPLLRQLASTH